MTNMNELPVSSLRYLYGFEEYCRSAQIQFRTVHHNNPRPVIQPDVKSVEQENEVEIEEKVDHTPHAKVKSEASKDQPDCEESDGEDEKSRKDICSPRVSVLLVLRRYNFM